MTHAAVGAKGRKEIGITDGMVRIRSASKTWKTSSPIWIKRWQPSSSKSETISVHGETAASAVQEHGSAMFFTRRMALNPQSISNTPRSHPLWLSKYILVIRRNAIL